jgi:thiamine-monophosphate kinase
VPANDHRLSERAAISILERALGGQRSRDVRVGIGDDAAVLAGGLVWTLDASLEGVHFDRRWLSLEQVGNRAIEAAVSDLAAMGAMPVAALVGLALPNRVTRREVDALARGQARAARRTRCPIVGGNITRGPALSLTTTVLGRAQRPLLRKGARAGDELWLVGSVGLARAGLLLLQQKRARPAVAVRAWREPRALLREGHALVGRASACIDVSDGLASDAFHLAGESGVALVIDETTLVTPLLRSASRALGVAPEELALTGGEDYALLATGPRRRRPAFAKRIGSVERGSGVFLAGSGPRRALARGGFDHLG